MIARLNVSCHIEGNYGLFYPILVILMALRSSSRNSNKLKEQLQSHKERRSGSFSSTNGEAKECPSAGLRLLLDPRFSTSTAVPVLTASSIGVPVLTAAAPSTAILVMAIDALGANLPDV